MSAHWLPPFADRLGMTITHVAPDQASAELAVIAERSNGFGILHGGAIMTLADTLGGAATIANLAPGATTSTLESKTNFLAPIRIGDIARAMCVPVHLGRTTMVWQTRITRGDGRLAAIVTQTQLLLPAQPVRNA